MNVFTTPPQTTPVAPPEGELITPQPVIMPTVAGEANFSRESFPFILKNFPDFSWKNPGQFDASVTDGVGYNLAQPAPGTGPEAHPEIFNALEGLNESYIRIAYLDADYEWQVVPFQIDQVGWPNIWQVADLNRWAGMTLPLQSEHLGADAVPGMGWINGDPTNSLGNSDAEPDNYLQIDWYRIPIHTYVSKYQPDGTYTNESVNIDQEYKEDLVWCYMNHANRPHNSWTQDDGYWQFYGSGNEAFVNTSDGAAPNTVNMSNVVFMGDTWFITPDNRSSNPQWVRNAFNYAQIDGMLDKDDEVCFYAYPGRRAPTWMWWNYSWFPNRFELMISDPVDGGICWMYIYYNDGSGANPGAPSYTTEYSDYVSWDPQAMTVTSDFYQISVDENNPSLLDNARIFGETDGQPLLEQFNKMYSFGEASMVGGPGIQIPAGREGIWYSWVDGLGTSYSELYCSLDNPSVQYPNVPEDTSDPDRTAPTSPQTYYGPRGSILGHTYGGGVLSPLGPSLTLWEAYGDGRAVIDGPCRVIFYKQQFLALGVYVDTTIVSVTVEMDIDVFSSLLDGPEFYYRRMQLSPPTTMTISPISGIDIQFYYLYMMCGTLESSIRGDYKITSGREWNGANDGTDQGVPTFGWADGMGWTKIGGLNPQTTSWILEGESIPDGNNGVGDRYTSQGDPLLDAQVAAAIPPATNTLPDWVMLTSETHGGVWIYFPRREIMEIRDNSPPSPPANVLMYYRDDVYRAEFGICINGPIVGGSTTSPYTYTMVFGDFKHADVAEGHKLYLQSYFPLTGIPIPYTPPLQFIYETVQPDKLIYRTGENVTVDITGWPDSGGGDITTITGDFTAVGGGASVVVTDTGTETWSVSQVISGGAGYDRTISFDAIYDPGSGPPRPTSTYDLIITVDDVPPNNPAVLDPLDPLTEEAAVLLDWSANPGNDTGSASMANPSGLSHYRLRRGTTSGGLYDTIVGDNIPITTTQFLDTFVVNGLTYYYKLDTIDAAGNNASMLGEVWTTIDIPFLPAQHNDLPATINPIGGIIIDWTANPGDPGITSYRVLRSGAIWLEDALAGTYTQVGPIINPSTTSYNDPGPFTEAYFYCYKVESTLGAVTVQSPPVHTRIDTVAPAPAELATPFDPYNSLGEEIVVSWAIETIPQYSSGGFPGQDLNGIAYWEIWRQENPPSTWELIATVPWGPATADQQVLDTAVTNGSVYEYRIRTYDGAGNWADNEYTKTTTLHVTGPGTIKIDAVTAGATEVTQGDVSVPVTVDVRNPGLNDVTLNAIQLYFFDDLIDVTSEYPGASVTGLSQNVAGLGGTWSTTLYVDVDPSATLGTIDVWAETTYNTSCTSGGGADSWLVKPDADLNVQTVTSTETIVHPGQEDITVTVNIKNPGSITATLDSVQLIFTREMTDISDKFMVEYISAMPTTLNKETKAIQLKVTISQGITAGAVSIDATCAGSAQGVPLSDTDGGISTWDWGVQTTAKPVIVSVEADAAVYWNGDTITLTVICDAGTHTVKAYFGNIDSGAQNETAGPAVGNVYTIMHPQQNSWGDGTYDVIVYAENASGTDTYIIPLRTGQAPTFSGWAQTPYVGNVLNTDTVDIDIDINDDNGPDSVTAVLVYRVDGGAWTTRPMIYAGLGHWDVIIPAQSAYSFVEYYINASDSQGNWDIDSHSYAVWEIPPPPPIIEETTHEAGNPGNVYDLANPAPFDSPIAYTITLETSFLTGPEEYVVLVSIFSPSYSCWIDINDSVWVEPIANVDVTLQITYDSGSFPPGTLVTGRAYLLTDLPSNLGQTVAMVDIQHLVA